MEITEEWVRGLTGWKPFKEGKSLADQGLVTNFKRTGDILQGSLSEGRLKLRPIVKIAGPSDVRVQCACPEHRAGGGICAHAVAVLLASLHGAKAPPAGSAADRPTTQTPATAWRVILSPRLAVELAEGKLSFRMLPAEATPSAADLRLHKWLAARNLRPGPQALRVAGADCADFLDTLSGHPKVEIEGQKGAFAISTEPAPPLRLADSRHEGSNVTLELAADELRRTLIRWGDSPAWIAAESLQRLPARSNGAAWLDRTIALAATGRLKLPLADFLENFDAWLDLFESPPPGWLGGLRLAGAEPGFELELDGSLDLLRARLLVRYPGLSARPMPEGGEAIPGLPGISSDGHLIARHRHAEEQAVRRLRTLGFETLGSARFQLRGHEAILDLMANALPALRREWTVTEGPEFRQAARRVHIVRPEIRETTWQGGTLSFELSFQTNSGKALSPGELRRLLQGGRRSARLANGAELVVSRSYEEWVEPLLDELDLGPATTPFQASKAQAIALRKLREKLCNPLPTNHQNALEKQPDESFAAVGLKADLRPYQFTGASWLIERLNDLHGALLADEMGLGKTIQTIAAICHFNQISSTPTLVVAPTSLLGNWMRELGHFAPKLKALLFHGANRDEKRDLVGKADVIVTSYSTLVRDLAFHLQSNYRLVVADEASLLRNPEADASKAMCKIPAEARLALSGTPVENRPQDLWSIFRFVAPGYLGERADFKERYEVESHGDSAARRGTLERLRIRISPFFLRRTKGEVASDLPDKIEIDEWLDLNENQAALYRGMARAGLAEHERIQEKQGEKASAMHLLTLLLRLRQICVDPALLNLEAEKCPPSAKIERLLEILQERQESRSKTLVFSQFSKNLQLIETRISDRCGRVFRLDGATRNRQELVDKFQAEPGAAVFLISLKAGGYGLNLTAADTVVHLDPWWNPAVEAQATDRAHRIGQTCPVTVYRLLSRDTVEERVRRMQERKRAIVAATTDEAAEIPRNWTLEELEDLLR